MIDLHSHVLPGVDDGAATLAESLDMLRSARVERIDRIAATPHVRDDYPTAVETMERLVATVNAAARAAGIGVEVLPGGELDLSVAAQLDDATLRRFGLGGNPTVLLVEFPYVGWPLSLPDLLFKLRVRGFRAVLAHPERNLEVQTAPERLRAVVDAGALVQLTAASLDGRLGQAPQATGLALARTGLAHMIASDAHAGDVRSIGMSAARQAVGDERLASWLIDDVPATLVEGRPLPVRPEVERRRRLLRHR